MSDAIKELILALFRDPHNSEIVEEAERRQDEIEAFLLSPAVMLLLDELPDDIEEARLARIYELLAASVARATAGALPAADEGQSARVETEKAVTHHIESLLEVLPTRLADLDQWLKDVPHVNKMERSFLLAHQAVQGDEKSQRWIDQGVTPLTIHAAIRAISMLAGRRLVRRRQHLPCESVVLCKDDPEGVEDRCIVGRTLAVGEIAEVAEIAPEQADRLYDWLLEVGRIREKLLDYIVAEPGESGSLVLRSDHPVFAARQREEGVGAYAMRWAVPSGRIEEEGFAFDLDLPDEPAWLRDWTRHPPSEPLEPEAVAGLRRDNTLEAMLEWVIEKGSFAPLGLEKCSAATFANTLSELKAALSDRDELEKLAKIVYRGIYAWRPDGDIEKLARAALAMAVFQNGDAAAKLTGQLLLIVPERRSDAHDPLLRCIIRCLAYIARPMREETEDRRWLADEVASACDTLFELPQFSFAADILFPAAVRHQPIALSKFAHSLMETHSQGPRPGMSGRFDLDLVGPNLACLGIRVGWAALALGVIRLSMPRFATLRASLLDGRRGPLVVRDTHADGPFEARPGRVVVETYDLDPVPAEPLLIELESEEACIIREMNLAHQLSRSAVEAVPGIDTRRDILLRRVAALQRAD